MKQRDWLLEIRNIKELTQGQVAYRADIERAYYTQIELGVRNPSVKVAKSIAKILGFNWTLFFDDNVAFCDIILEDQNNSTCEIKVLHE